MYEEIYIKLNPYLSSSENLIDFFAVIGYEEKMLNECNDILGDKNNLKLLVISKVLSESFQTKINFDDIIKKIYPEKPNIYPKSEFLKPPTTNVIFSSCIDSIDGKKKIFYSCYALRFYEQFRDINKKEYYVPKAFLIYSQYPYFTTFYHICYKLQIYNEFYIEDQIPIEILIYCLVNFIPSPIKNKIILMDFKPNIIIPKLTGYPYIDFDLCKIFNLLPIKEFIKIYIIVFLELDLLIFSHDLEKLNIFMYMIYIINYPLLDSNYFWHIKSISKKDFNIANELMGSIFLGVNTDYNKNIDLKNFKSLNFVVDLETKNKKKIINYINQGKESEETSILLNYIHKLLKHKEKRSIFLKDCLILLKRKLKAIKKEYIAKIGKKNLKSNSFFYVDENISLLNRKIQEAFYDFNLTIIRILKNDYKYDYSTLSIIKNKKIKEQNFIDEENIFLKYFRFTIKYTCYFDNFISYFNSVDEFKLSLLISDEFVNLKEKQINNALSGNYFKIMDELYYSNNEPDKINFSKLIDEFNLLSKLNLINNIEKEPRNNIFILDNKIIEEFLSYKNNKGFFQSLKNKKIKENNVDSIKMIKISLIMQNYFNQLLNPLYFLRASIIYVFSIIFPFFHFSDNILFLSNILFTFKTIDYFQRFYITIFLKSFSKYFSENTKNFHFPELTFDSFKNYCELIKEQLLRNSILPNEEIYNFFKNLLSENNKRKKEKINDNNNDNNKIDNNNSYFTYNYDKEECYFIDSIEDDMIVKTGNCLIFNFKGQKKQYNLKSQALLFQQISLFYEDYFTRLNFNIEYMNSKAITEIIINLIYYLIQIEDLDMSCFLLNGIILLKKFKDELDSFRKSNKIIPDSSGIYNRSFSYSYNNNKIMDIKNLNIKSVNTIIENKKE